MRPAKQERELYEPVKAQLERLLQSSPVEFHLEITAEKNFSNKLKAAVPQHREIILFFLKEAPPDITGFIRGQYSTDFLVVEIKPEKIKLDDIYQTKKYAELFEAKYVLLVSPE